MTPDLIAIAERVGPALANHLWQSTCFGTLIWVLTLLLRKDRAQARHLLWLVASAKFLIPFSLLVGLGAHSLKLDPHAVPLATSVSATVNAMGQPFSDWQESQSATQESPQNRHLDWLAPALALVWLLGAAAVAAVWAVRLRRAASVLHNASRSANGQEVATLRKLESLIGVRQCVAVLWSPEVNEPGIYGIFRPMLLWPERLTERLKQESLESILAHELMHVRRWDNLTAAIHMVVETVFWFHPMAWWIGSHLMEERERACDEAAVQLVSKPDIYAESLLTACRFCVEPPVACISGINGADLRARIHRIMSTPIEREMSVRRKTVVIAAAILSLGAPVALGMFGRAQDRNETSRPSAASLPKFEVASIKPSKDDASGNMMVDVRFAPDGLTLSGLSLSMLLHEAFGVSEDRVVGAPGWAKSERFDIDAKVNAEDVAALGKLNLQDRWAMMLPLLDERFGLKFHHETKELQVYTLVVAKGGPKLTESKPVEGEGKDGAKQMIRRSSEGMTMEGAGAPIENLARAIGREMGATVLDKTGLTGHYDYKLTWEPEQGMPMMPGGHGAGSEPGGGASTSPTGPSLVTALQEQLGLKLETKKEPVDVIVIDQINQPSPN